MANPGIQAGVLLSFLCAMFLIEITVQTNPPCPVSYLVTVPAILKSESKDRFCVSLTDPGSYVLLKVVLKSKNKQKEVFNKGTSNAFNKCVKFKVPHVNGEEEHLFEVTVKGNDFYSYDATRVLIKSFHPKTLIQTDKHIYNQGEEVKFRALTLDHDLDPLHVTYNHIWIEDPHHNKIAKWKDEEVDKTILPLSYHLGDGAVAGLYRITVQSGNKIESQSFRVQKHGLTKFKFEIHVPHEVSVGEETFQVKVCTKYYYGRPAVGEATVKVCRPLRDQDSCSSALVLKDDVSLTSLCKDRQKQTCDKGCATFTLKMSYFLRPDTKHLLDMLDVKVTLKDKETCLSHTQWERIRISYVIGKLSFQNVPPVYSRDTDLEGQVWALDVHGNPVPNLKVYLFELKHGAPCIVQTLTTDEHGIAYFALPTEKQIGPIHLFASSQDTLEPGQHVGAYYEVAKVKVDVPGPGPETCGFLKVLPIERKLVCSSMEDFTVQYSLSQKISENITIIYLVLSRGEIVQEGEEKLTYSSGVIQGTFTITFRVKPQYAPKIHIVVYTILDCVRVLAHSESFDTQHCFENSVHPKFHPSPVTHDQNVKFCVKANQHSVCGVKIIDALTKRDGKTLDKEQIFAILPEIKGSPVPPELQDHSDCVEVLPRSYYAVSTNQDGADAQTVFNEKGLQVLTNRHINRPTCIKLGGIKYKQALLGRYIHPKEPEIKDMELSAPGRLSYSCKDEEFEPDYEPSGQTWLFDLINLGDNTESCLSLTVPNSITSWTASVFCVNPHAFGLSPPEDLNILPKYILDFRLPDSMIQGESLKLNAIIINKQSVPLMVKVTAEVSTDYILIAKSAELSTLCLCSNDFKILEWTMTPKHTGTISVTLKAEPLSSEATCCHQHVTVPENANSVVVTRSLEVKAGGQEVIKTTSWLLCPKGHYVNKAVEIDIPNSVIGGSLSTHVSVSGHILGWLLHNLDNQEHLPNGCGEQNIAYMEIYANLLHYLQSTHQLSNEIETKGLKLLTQAYQNQLACMNKVYAFSTSVSGEVDTWFTAWVMKVFHKASKLIYIDPRIVVVARKWLECHLQKDGCFKVFGKNFAKRFPDAGSKEVIVCAHVTIALLEMNIPVHNPFVQKSLTNLKQNIDEHSSVYAKALLVYCLTLAKDWGASSKLMHHLDSIAIKEGEFLYWCPVPNDKVSSLCVEITSYILLAKLSSSHSGEELSCSFSIVKWLFHVQFHHCGSHYFKAFSLAFKAITLYSSFGSKHYGSTSVTVTSSADHLSFHVNEQNKLIYQKMELQNPRGHYQLKAEGSSCTAVQITSVYGVAPSTTVCSFSVEVEVVVQKCCEERLITLKLKSSYKGTRSSTSVVVVKLEVPSGFSPDPNSLKKLKKADHVNDVDYKSGHVIVYLQELSNDHPVYHQLDLIQEHEVHDLRHSTVIIYELDCPSVRGGTKYCGKTCTEYIDSHTHEYHHYLPDQESHHDHDNKIYKDSALHCGRSRSIRPACRRQRLKVKRPRFKFGLRHSLYE